MKRVRTIIISMITALCVSLSAFGVYGAEAGSNPFLLGSSVTDTITAAKQLGILDDNMVTSDVVTRKELCRMIVRFYRASTGGTGITLSRSPFYDCDANEVTFCYENGIIEGIGDVTFAPDYFVSRQEAADIVVNAINACGANIIEPEKDFTLEYSDRGDIAEEYVKDVSYLTSIDVINGYGGYFYPQSYITFEQAASMLVESYYQLMLSKISINGKQISLGDEEAEISEKFGQPSYKLEDGNKVIWVYKQYMTNFFFIGFCEGKVSEIFSNGNSFVYRGIASGSDVSDVDFGARAEISGNKAFYNDGYGIVQTGAFSLDNKINYVYASVHDSGAVHKISNSTMEKDTELLYDIINSERIKRGLPEFTKNTTVEAAAKQHSLNMGYWNYSDYTNRDGASPFERFGNRGLDYIMASENIARVSGLVVEIYIEWMENPGSRSNLLTDYMDTVGIGMNISTSDKLIYATMDFLKLRS